MLASWDGYYPSPACILLGPSMVDWKIVTGLLLLSFELQYLSVLLIGRFHPIQSSLGAVQYLLVLKGENGLSYWGTSLKAPTKYCRSGKKRKPFFFNRHVVVSKKILSRLSLPVSRIIANRRDILGSYLPSPRVLVRTEFFLCHSLLHLRCFCPCG